MWISIEIFCIPLSISFSAWDHFNCALEVKRFANCFKFCNSLRFKFTAIIMQLWRVSKFRDFFRAYLNCCSSIRSAERRRISKPKGKGEKLFEVLWVFFVAFVSASIRLSICLKQAPLVIINERKNELLRVQFLPISFLLYRQKLFMKEFSCCFSTRRTDDEINMSV